MVVDKENSLGFWSCPIFVTLFQIASHQVGFVLKALSNCKEKPLPPLDWYSLLWPLREKFKAELDEKSIISIAVNQKSIQLLSKLLSKSVFDDLQNESKLFLAENIEILLKILPNKRQILDIFSSDRGSVDKFYTYLSIAIDRFDQNTAEICQDFFVLNLSELKIDSYEKFFSQNSSTLISICPTLDDKRFEKTLEKVDFLTKFVFYSSKFVSKIENIEAFNQLVQIYSENLTSSEK